MTRARRKGQASAFNVTRDVRGEACLVERAFGLGADVPTQTVQQAGEQLKLGAAQLAAPPLFNRLRAPSGSLHGAG